MDIFDLAIIGGGPAGYRAAWLAAKGGLETILFEKKHLGGTCLNEGCIPTKALLNSAKIYMTAKEGSRFGVHASSITLDHKAAMEHKNRVTKMLVNGIEMKMKRAGVTVVTAAVQIKENSKDGFILAVDGKEYTAKRLLICSGSVPIMPPIAGLKESLISGFAVTSTELLDLMDLPPKLVVIGGGVIGLEMASYYCEAGSQVEVIEMLPKIGGSIDEKLSTLLQKALEKAGIKFYLSCKVTRFHAGKVVIKKDGAEHAIAADMALVSVGRKPFTEGLGLETIGVAMEQGAILVDEKGRTNVDGVFAAGDVNGKSLLAHTAYREAELCVNTMLGHEDRINYGAIPAVIYTHPEVASVGLTTELAQQRDIAVDVVELPLRYSGRYIAENPSGNDICIFVAEKTTRRILGIHMCGNYASEMIYGGAMMIERGMHVEDVCQTVFPHPTVSEVLRDAAFEFPLVCL